MNPPKQLLFVLFLLIGTENMDWNSILELWLPQRHQASILPQMTSNCQAALKGCIQPLLNSGLGMPCHVVPCSLYRNSWLSCALICLASLLYDSVCSAQFPLTQKKNNCEMVIVQWKPLPMRECQMLASIISLYLYFLANRCYRSATFFLGGN